MAAKDVIGALVAGLIPDGASLLINAGTTTLAVVRHLTAHRDLIIATNSLAIPNELPPRCFREIYVFGGSVRMSAQATVGPVGFLTMMGQSDVDISCDLAVICVGGVTPGGYFSSNVVEAAMMGQMMDRATQVAVIADSGKAGRRDFARVGDLDRADWFVTDAPPPPDLAEAFNAAGVEVVFPSSDKNG